MFVGYVSVFAVLFGMVLAQSEIPGFDSKALPVDLQGKVDTKTVEAIQNKTLTEAQARCEKNGGPDAFAKANQAKQDLEKCVTTLVNVTVLQQEIEEAKPNGRVDEVFKKYCNKKPQFEGCIKNFTEDSKQCLTVKEQGHLKTVYNVSQQLAEFICFKEGDRIALFIAEGGQECFQEKQEGLQECVNKTMGLPSGTGEGVDNFDVNSLSDMQLSFDEKQCKQMVDLQNCLVGVLETCPKPTSANIVESLFKFIRKATPCNKFSDEDAKTRSQAEEKKKSNSATVSFVTTATVATALLTALIV